MLRDYCRNFVRGNDYNLYLLHFFTPVSCRDHILSLMALHTELHMIPQKVADPMMRIIRLKWWQDEIEKIRAGDPFADSPILDGLSQCDILPSMDDYFDRFGQSMRGDTTDIDEVFYKIMASVIDNEKSRNRFVKKLMHHDQLEDKQAFRALRLWFGI